MRIVRYVPAFLIAFCAIGYNATFTVNTSLGKAPISRYIYGVNSGAPDYRMTADLTEPEHFTARRLGGNGMTAYNWETNYSNSGSADGWNNSNGDAAGNGFPAAIRRTPGIVQDSLIGYCKSVGQAPVIQLQLAGYVAADGAGQVTSAPPSSRWKTVVPLTPGYSNAGFTFPASPVTTDAYVYIDEFIHHVVTRNGAAPVNGVQRFYELDNEPDCWQGTHSLMHPAAITCMEYLTKSIQTALAVKRNDPGALVNGPAMCCFYGYLSLGTSAPAPDWSTVKGSHVWFISWYLEQMKHAEDSLHTAGLLPAGVRLFDVMDLHLYPDGSNPIYQDPRCLWDTTYANGSGGADENSKGIKPYYPRIISNINQYYPGTKFGCTEWNYGTLGTNTDDVTVGLADADVLGVDGKFGSFLRTIWTVNDIGPFGQAAYKMYRNYDGLGHGFGDTTCQSTFSDRANTSFYSSIEGQNLHLILINKNTSALSATVTVTSPPTVTYTTGEVWTFGGTTYGITKAASSVTLSGGQFTYTLAASSVAHIIFKYGPQNSVLPRGSALAGTGYAGIWWSQLSKQLSYNVPGNKAADITVTNAVGKVVGSYHGITGAGNLAIGESSLSKGVYFATISSNDENFSQKLVVTR